MLEEGISGQLPLIISNSTLVRIQLKNKNYAEKNEKKNLCINLLINLYLILIYAIKYYSYSNWKINYFPIFGV